MKKEEALTIQKEIDILSKLEHPNIVAFIGIKQLNNETFIVMEYMNGRDLLTYIRKNDSVLTQNDLFNMASQVCFGMEYLEEKNIIHK